MMPSCIPFTGEPMARSHHHAPRPHPSGRAAKPRREFGDPVAAPKQFPDFIPAPLTNNTNLVLPLHAVMPDDWIVNAGKLVFHMVGDTGGIHDASVVQDQVAGVMEDQVTAAASDAVPAFFYHLGDVIYFNGQSYYYRWQFYFYSECCCQPSLTQLTGGFCLP
jgi:hypothetical protein